MNREYKNTMYLINNASLLNKSNYLAEFPCIKIKLTIVVFFLLALSDSYTSEEGWTQKGCCCTHSRNSVCNK